MRPTIERIAAALFALVAALAVSSWISAREDRARLGATLDAQRQVIADAQKREDSRAADLRAALDQIAALKRSVVTPADVLRALPGVLPSLPQPIEIHPPGTSLSSAPSSGADSSAAASRDSSVKNPSLTREGQPTGAGNSPAGAAQSGIPGSEATKNPSSSSDSSLTIPQADLKPLYDYLQDCRACQLQLTAAQADLTDERAKSAALTKERDAAVKAGKGGGFWSRVKHGAKWFAIGAAVGATAALSAH